MDDPVPKNKKVPFMAGSMLPNPTLAAGQKLYPIFE
jgi:hypothetical protein